MLSLTSFLLPMLRPLIQAYHTAFQCLKKSTCAGNRYHTTHISTISTLPLLCQQLLKLSRSMNQSQTLSRRLLFPIVAINVHRFLLGLFPTRANNLKTTPRKKKEVFVRRSMMNRWTATSQWAQPVLYTYK